MSTGSQKRVTDQFPLFETASQRHQVPLLEPKFHAPRLHATHVERKRLLEKLDAALQGKLTLLCAPAGFGKTTLISQWMENNRVRGQASLAQPSADLPPFEIPSLEMVLTLLLNNIARFASSRLLILEDYHLITEPHIHETMTFFLDHLPAQLHVVILTRSEPPLPLVRWRARGELTEMHAADLRFSREEMANFFQRVLAFSPSILPAEAFNQLETRLEGWAAGLRLLALALQGSANQQGVEHVITTFAGEQRSFQDYFVTEVLSVQSEALQDFLLHTSILSRLTGSLCDGVAERHDSDRLLEDIERAGIFLESLDRTGEWYRYQALFAEAMQAEARRRLGVGVLHALSLKASRWYEQQRMFAEAVEAAFQAQDTTRAAD
jgi:LuxR family maltose regulon positive regulatory protein